MSHRSGGFFVIVSILLAALPVLAQPAATGHPDRAASAPVSVRERGVHRTAPTEIRFRSELGTSLSIAHATVWLDGRLLRGGPLGTDDPVFDGRLVPGVHTLTARLEPVATGARGPDMRRAGGVRLGGHLRFTAYEGRPTVVEIVAHPAPGPTIEIVPALDFMVAYPGPNRPSPGEEHPDMPHQIPYRDPA